MAVLNRQMFRQPFPVVRRMAGTPQEGEVTVEDYIDKGYDTYEYTADKAQQGWSDDKINQWKEEQALKFLNKNKDKGGILQWLKKQGNKISDFMDTGWASRDDLMRIGNEWFDPDDPNFKRFIESYWMEEGDSYIDGIEKWRMFVETSSGRGDDTEMLIEGQEHIVPRQAGSPPTGEIDPASFNQRANEIMSNPNLPTLPTDRAGRGVKKYDRDEGVYQFTMDDFVALEKGNWNTEAILKLVQAFGTQEEINVMINLYDRHMERGHMNDEDSDIKRSLWNKYLPNIGGMEEYWKAQDRANEEVTFGEGEIHLRQAGSPMQGEITPQESNLYYGDQGEQALYAELLKVLRGEIIGIEAQQVMQAAIGEFGEDFIKSLMAQGNNITSPAEGQFSGMPHQGTGMDGPYWRQDPSGAVSRQMGSPQMGEQANANNVGIMDGFEEEQVAQQVMGKGSAAKDQLDQASTYDELMQAIRGDNLTEHDRRQELAGIVGEDDAARTPDSVLALVQPVIQMLTTEESQQGIGATDQAQAMNIPVEQEEVVGIQETMAANGGLIRRYGHGGPIQYFNQGDSVLATKHAEYLPTYMGVVDKYLDPKQGEADALFALSRAGFNWGLGASPTEASAMFFDELSKKGSKRAEEERALRMKMDLSALSAAQAEMLAEAKAKKEKSKQKQNLTVGLNKQTDDFIAKILGITKIEKTRVGPDTDEEEVIDWEKFYRLYPEGTSLQWSWDWTQFFGKKGSAIRYEGVEKEKDGGIVHRQAGTPEDGEVIDEIFVQEGMATGTEKDDINKIVARSQATLKELLRMKEILVSHPEIGGFPGMLLETFQGLFTMIDQVDDAYMGDKIFRKEGKLSKMFNKAEIQEIQMLKNSIAAGIADLRSFKGTRQPTEKQQELSLGEIDPTGWFGRDVAMQKVDAVAEKVARLVKEYVKVLTTKEGSTEIDQTALLGKFNDIDAFVDSIHNFAVKEEMDTTTGNTYSLQDLEAIINATEGD
jgi:hypothetical protein